jgi:hypothetical protein
MGACPGLESLELEYSFNLPTMASLRPFTGLGSELIKIARTVEGWFQVPWKEL